MNTYQKFAYLLSCVVLWPVWKIFVRLEVINRSGYDLKKIHRPLIITANHGSLLDGFIICNSFNLFSKIHYIRYMVADNWMRGIDGLYLKSIGCFPTFYGQGLEKSLKIPREILGGKGTLMIFPRGRRRIRLHYKKAKIGAAVLALESNTPILPIKIVDSHPGNTKKLFFGKRRIKVIVGQVYYLKDKIKEKRDYTYEDYMNATRVIVKEISYLNNQSH